MQLVRLQTSQFKIVIWQKKQQKETLSLHLVDIFFTTFQHVHYFRTMFCSFSLQCLLVTYIWSINCNVKTTMKANIFMLNIWLQ